MALYAYCIIPFNKVTDSNPLIHELAGLLNRSSAAVKMKIGNFGSFDPKLQQNNISGLINVSRIDREVWNHYSQNWSQLPIDTAKIVAQLQTKGATEFHNLIDIANNPNLDSTSIDHTTTSRIGQQFFRQSVLSAYSCQCCISGIHEATLLEACHISPWSEDTPNRLNPANGLCLNPLFHVLFDKLYISISPDYVLHISTQLMERCDPANSTYGYLMEKNNSKIILPSRFLPDKNLLAIHFNKFNNQ